MSKKLTFLFVVTFIITLVWFSSYLIVKETRGIEVGGNLIMGGNRISNVAKPTASLDLFTKNYLEELPKLDLGDNYITSWCDVQYFSWCSGAPDPYPEQGDGEPEPECGDGECDPGETEGSCPEDCGPLEQ